MTDGGNEYHRGNPGMSLRDWFAGQALSTLLVEVNRNEPPEQIARWAYKLADAMLKARGGT